MNPKHAHPGQRVKHRSVGRLILGAALGGSVLLLAVAGWWVWPRGDADLPVAVQETGSQGPAAVSRVGSPGKSVGPPNDPGSPHSKTPNSRSAHMDDRFLTTRQSMVEHHLRRRDITEPRVLEAMQRTPRHLFVAEAQQDAAYADRPLSIGAGQTISQPYIVALMTQLAQPQPGCRALDVGTGSGYQAAVLSELCRDVYSIEIVPALAEEAQERLAGLGYDNVRVRAGDGYRGWPEYAPFDVIIVAAAPDHVPQPLVQQLAPGGRLIIPIGNYHQNLTVVEKQADGTTRQWTEVPVAFVPMTGEARQDKSDD